MDARESAQVLGCAVASKAGNFAEAGDQEWALTELRLLSGSRTGRSRKNELRAVINVLRYLVSNE